MDISDFLIKSDDSLFSALEKINANKRQFLIVADAQGKLLGTLTDGDVRRVVISSSGNIDLKSIPVDGHFNTPCAHVKQGASLTELIEKFRDEKINFLPIVDNNNKVVDVLTKKQLHTLLTHNLQFPIFTEKKLFTVDDSFLESEIEPRPWGFYKALLSGEDTKVKILVLNPGEETSHQLHKKREEFWVVVKGKGKIRLDASERVIVSGSYIYIPKECKHQIVNSSDRENLTIVEVQIGEYFGEDDIIRVHDKHRR